jgi:pseudouridylate synthase I
MAYNGSNYHGYQIQPHSSSVQAELEKCLSLKLMQPVSVTGCGRTDTGVHARNYYAHFEVEKAIPDVQKLVEQLNLFLPSDIAIYRIWEVSPCFHARFDALSRTYRYYIIREKNPFHQQDAYFQYGVLDVEKMQKAADLLFEYEDFTSFSKLHTQVRTNNCKILEAFWTETSDGLLVFQIKADRFLRNMVRAIVGTLLEVGKGRMSLDGFKTVIEQKDRCSAGFSVPAHALFLEEVEYPKDVMLEIMDFHREGNHSLVIYNQTLRSFDKKGVADLFQLFVDDPLFLKNAYVADKVVGKGAAALMALGGVARLHAEIISQPALNLLLTTNCKVSFDQLVPQIRNRDNTDFCPVEKLCLEETDLQVMMKKISAFLHRLE